MFFGNNNKLTEELKEKDEQINALQLAIQELNHESREQVKVAAKELRKSNHKLGTITDDVEKLKTKLEYKTKEYKALSDELETVTNSDFLTGAYNKRYFYDIAENIISLSKREKKEFSVAVLHIDKFEEIKENHGEDVSNKVLQALVQKITKEIRESDVFVKFTDEEFVFLFPNTTTKQAVIASEKIRKAVESSNMVYNVKFTVSIGVAEFAQSKDNINDTVERARTTLNEAQKISSNSVVNYLGKSA